MRLSCPNCLTEYDVPEAALAGRNRRLKCSQCGHQWRLAAAQPATDAITAESLPELPVEPAAGLAAATIAVPPGAARPQGFAPRPVRPVLPPAPPPRRSLTALVVLFVIVVVVIVGLADHAAIARNWPASAKFFAALGLR